MGGKEKVVGSDTEMHLLSVLQSMHAELQVQTANVAVLSSQMLAASSNVVKLEGKVDSLTATVIAIRGSMEIRMDRVERKIEDDEKSAGKKTSLYLSILAMAVAILPAVLDNVGKIWHR